MLSTRFSGLGDRREKRTVEIESRESRKAVPQSGAWGMCADFETTRWTRREQRVFCGVVVIILRFPFKIAADHQGVPAASHSSRGSRGQRRFKRRRRSSLRSKKRRACSRGHCPTEAVTSFSGKRHPSLPLHTRDSIAFFRGREGRPSSPEYGVIIADLPAGDYFLRSSYRTCFAEAFRVSNTPMPWVATASKVGSPLVLSARYMVSTATAVGRSRLLN